MAASLYNLHGGEEGRRTLPWSACQDDSTQNDEQANHEGNHSWESECWGYNESSPRTNFRPGLIKDIGLPDVMSS